MKKKIFLLLFCLFITSCTTSLDNSKQDSLTQTNNDPLESYNRVMTNFNFKVNRYVYDPVAKVYRNVIPSFMRTGISNFGSNLSEPYVFVNAILQCEPKSAAHSLGRFFTNTTLGLGGLFDVASHFEIEKKKRNFAQTLYKWGWKGTSTYFVLPFLGPSDFRETVGMTVGWFLDPIDYVLPRKDRWRLRIGRYTINGIITIEEATDLLTGIETSSVDPYATLRTMYQQNKQKFLNDGDIEAQSESYNFEFDLDD